MMNRGRLWLLIPALCTCCKPLAQGQTSDKHPPGDPLLPILRPVLKSTVDVVLENYQKRKYTDERIPMAPARFREFQQDVVTQLAEGLGLTKWQIREPKGKKNALLGKFKDRLLKTITHHGIQMEVHAVTFPETDAIVPMVICLPPGTGKCPGVCAFSGHTRHGLRDLVLDLNSYQRGMAVRLAKAGFVSIAVEKIDTGYLSRNGIKGVDENPIATLRLHRGRVTRSHQLMACLAAAEILALHPRVDEGRIGATGVSLGGWLSIQTALLSDRIGAVADFGRKTLTIAPGTKAAAFRGQVDLCHIIPGMLSLCDRNLLALAYAPRPLLAGHGRKDKGPHSQGPVYYRALFRKQYQALGREGRYEYHVHDGADTMPDGVVIRYFQRVFIQ